MSERVRVLHVIQYLSLGGAGRAMIAAAKYMSQTSDMQHDVVSLLPPEDAAVGFAEQEGMKFIPTSTIDDLRCLIPDYDLIQLQWWNNAEMGSLLREPLPPCRLVAWCHVGGHIAPQVIPDDLVHTLDCAVACSPHTYRSPAFQSLSAQERLVKCAMAYGAADFARVESVTPQQHAGFQVGYIGTIHFSKMHPDFVSMSASVDVPEVRFVVCGGGGHEELIRQQATSLGVMNRFDLRGYVDDIASILSELDVYGYPLCEENYSGSEVNLQEVMYAGIPPVVFPYGGVRYLVVDNYTGLVVHSDIEYKQAIEHLYHNPEERARIGKNAAEYARQIFGAKNAAKVFLEVYERILKLPKRAHLWNEPACDSILDAHISQEMVFPPSQELSGADLFTESLAGQFSCFLESMRDEDLSRLLEHDEAIGHCTQLLQDTVSVQYLRCFPRDAVLHFWTGLIHRARLRYQEALASFDQAAQLGFSHWRLLWYITHCAKEVGAAELVSQASTALVPLLRDYGIDSSLAARYRLPVVS